MIRFLRKLWKDRRGNILILAGVGMPVLVGAAGLATDTIEWTLWKRQLQRAADSAAIAGVYERESESGGTTNTDAAVSHDLTINLHTSMGLASGYPQVAFPTNTTYQTDQVKVTLAVQQALPFTSFFLKTAPVITVSAQAASISSGTPCALALNGTGTAMNYSGNATVSAPTCILYSDSGSANSASAGGSSAVTAKSVAAVGGIKQSNNFNVTQYIPYSPSIADPFSSVTPSSSDMKCAGHYTTVKVKGVSTNVWVYDALSESTNLSDATAQYMDSSGVVHTGTPNCWTSLSTSSSNKTGMTVPANFGPIYIDANSAHGGNGSVDMQGIFNCSGCTLVLTNSDSTSNTIGTFSANAQSNTNITAPTTGTFSGIAVYQDRRASGQTDKINGGSSNVIQGAVYFPKDTLQINGTGTSTSLCAMWVANNITFQGNSSIAISSPDDAVCSGDGLPSSKAVHMVRLVG